MKCTERTAKNRSAYHWTGFAAASALAAALAGCGGGGGGTGEGWTATVAPGAIAPGVTAVAGAPPAPPAPTGTSPITLTATTPPATFAALTPVVAVGGVAISSPPIVTFSVSDGKGNAIIGLGSKSMSSTATVASYPNLAFSLAKLVPGKDGSPSKWVSYIVTTVPTKNATTGTITASTATRPTTDNTGTLTDYGNGVYVYKFYRDIPNIRAQVAAMTLTAPNVAADLGDLTYDPTLTHRLTIAIYGNAPGTGTNQPDGVQKVATDAVPMKNPINIVYDFVPATGKAVTSAGTQRLVVATEKCEECHNKLGGIPNADSTKAGFHGGARNDARYCVVCHTDQRKFGRTNVASIANAFPAITETKGTVNAFGSTGNSSYSPSTYVADGVTLGDFPVMVHKIHNGLELVKANYNYANVRFDEIGYSMLGNGQKMCIKCHDSTKAAQADNWNTVPSRLACGSCHDGINWATGAGSTLADKAKAAAAVAGTAAATSGHKGGEQADDKVCYLCHTAAKIKANHRMENFTTHNPTVTPGLKNFTYDIKSAAVNSTTNDLTIVFRILASTSDANGVPGASAPVTFLAPAAGMSAPLSGFTGSPSFLLAYTMTQDGITTPVDYNNLGMRLGQPNSVSIAALLNTNASQAADGSITGGPDADGYYTASLKGTGTKVFPVGAKMRAVALQGYFTQVSPAAARHTVSVVKEVTGDTPRRTVVDSANCAKCHEWFEGHGGNRVYQTQVCVVCHNPNLATSGRGISDAALLAYNFTAADVKVLNRWGFDKTKTNAALQFPVTSNNFKDLIHGIHAGKHRTTPFMDARDRLPSAIALLDFSKMAIPGILKNCETCHRSGTYGDVPANALASTYEWIDAAYANAISAGTATAAIAKTALGNSASRTANVGNTTDKVTSPFAAACITCHDSATAQNHIGGQNGTINSNRSVFQTSISTLGKGEACGFCHGAGKTVDITVAHKYK